MKSNSRLLASRAYSFLTLLVSTGPLLGQNDPAVPAFNASLSTMALQADGKIIAAGGFTTINNLPRNYLARFSSNGLVDAPFVSEPNDSVLALRVQRDGKIIMGSTSLRVSATALSCRVQRTCSIGRASPPTRRARTYFISATISIVTIPIGITGPNSNELKAGASDFVQQPNQTN